MKKLFLGLLATVMFAFIGNAQVKLSANAKSAVDAQMVMLVHVAYGTTYQKGMSQADFMKATGPAKPTKDENALLQKLYKYVSEGTPDCEIMKQDNSVLVTVAQSGTVSDTPTSNKFPWKALLNIVVEIILEIVLPLMP